MLWIWMLLDNMKMAREKAKIGMLTSDVDTAPSDVERAKSRERRHKNQFPELDDSGVEIRTRQPLKHVHQLEKTLRTSPVDRKKLVNFV